MESGCHDSLFFYGVSWANLKIKLLQDKIFPLNHQTIREHICN